MKIGNNIRHIRELRNLTQQALATEIDLSQKQLSRIEKDEISPTIELVSKICAALDVSLQEMLKFNSNYIFNNITHNQKGEYINYNNTAIKQIENLYKQLIEEKDRTIKLLETKL